MPFNLQSTYQPTGDQPQAISALSEGIRTHAEHQVLLGVTGSGKTFTMANVIQEVKKPTLIIAHNKTLAAQLYQEFRDFFPNNAVSYFVSYYDYYQPEAYIPSSDTYIEKDSSINDEIDKLRLATTTNLLTRPDVIVVASVSCIYNLGSPVEYGKYVLRLVEGEVIARETIMLQLSNLQYERSETELFRGSFRVRGDTIQVWPAYEERALRIDTLEHRIERITWIDPISGSPLSGSQTPAEAKRAATQKAKLEQAIHQAATSDSENPQKLAAEIVQLKKIADQELADQNAYSRRKEYIIYPAKHYMMDPKSQTEAIKEIRSDLAARVTELTEQGKKLEAYRLQQKVQYDLEMITELGFVNGIENYSRYFDGRLPGDAPFSLLDYFTENAKNFNTDGFLTIIDESHITLPQIRGMYNGDLARKKTLVEYGFRLPSALDNRPLKFDEFLGKNDQFIHVSATPSDWELSHSQGKVVEQVVRPTGLLDPQVELRPTEGQIEDLVIEILNRVERGQRTLVTTLTKKMAEALTDYLNDHIKISKLVRSFKQKVKTQAEDHELQASDMSKADPDQTLWTGCHYKKWNGQDIPVDDLKIGPIPEQYFSQAQIESKLAAKNDTDITFPKVAYLHSDIDTIERSDILDDLRRGTYDVLVGINLLREGLDLPEVTLVVILDADKEGFLRSSTSLIQTMGRAARHSEGHVICYADNITNSMQKAIGETQRRRQVQIAYNTKHGIDPTTISKPIRERMTELKDEKDVYADENNKNASSKRGKLGKSQNPLRNRVKKIPSNVIFLSKSETVDLSTFNPAELTPLEKRQFTKKFSTRMKRAADTMDYELAAILRDFIREMEK
jgi:excinuclease ABC subunit B